MNIISNIIATLLINISSIYTWKKVYGDKKQIGNIKIYIGLFIMTVLVYINFYIFKTPYASFITIIILFFTNKYIFSKSIVETLISTLLYEITMIITETIYVLVFMLIINSDVKTLLDKATGDLLLTILISFTIVIIAETKIYHKIYTKILSFCEKLKVGTTIFYIALIIITYNLIFFAFYESLLKNNSNILLIFQVVLSIIYSVIIYIFLSTKYKYYKITEKYNCTLDSLSSYEDILTRYRLNNHENKNEWRTIANMISNNDKSTADYIKKIITDKDKQEKKVTEEVAKLPSGGIRAIIYSKILYMQEHNIKYELHIEDVIKEINNINYDKELILNICKIVGIHLDNAIEYAIKNKEIVGISIYFLNDFINIAITNTYKGIINSNQTFKVSNKGKDHGYGLLLVKEIIKTNRRLYVDTNVYDDLIAKTLKVKI